MSVSYELRKLGINPVKVLPKPTRKDLGFHRQNTVGVIKPLS